MTSARTLDVVTGTSGHAPIIELVGVTKVFRTSSKQAPFTALQDVSFAVETGQFVALVGPTGCGKSTTLSLISGLEHPTSGAIRVNGDPVSGVRNDLGFVFQNDALLPWRTAVENVELALKFRGMPHQQARDRARQWLGRVGLGGFETSYPHQLSGGMCKRVSLAATMVYEPSVLLMDEPFSALDVQTRAIMENDLLSVWQQVAHQTVLFVTHDLEEAIGLSDRVIVFTARPARVLGDYRVELPRPRNLLAIKLHPEFIELYRKIWADLEGEVLRAGPWREGDGPQQDRNLTQRQLA